MGKQTEFVASRDKLLASKSLMPSQGVLDLTVWNTTVVAIAVVVADAAAVSPSNIGTSLPEGSLPPANILRTNYI